MTALKVYFVVGEESGDALGADLLDALRCDGGSAVEPMGLAGPQLGERGVRSLFNIADIAIMGIAAVFRRLPTIVLHVYRTVDDIVAKNPDVVVLIDSPDFVQAVAKRVRKRAPHIPIINYVCPSVWAWRSGRARAMAAYIDHVLALLPFEPTVLQELAGPPATYVGHPLATRLQALPPRKTDRTAAGRPPVLLVLPGSRRSEVARLLEPFGETLAILKARGVAFEAVIPAVDHVRKDIEVGVRSWTVQPRIVSSKDNDDVFSTAQAALAASGTVTLQLALQGVPLVAAYKLDPFAQFIANRAMTTWSASLPNLIADRMVIQEDYAAFMIPGRIARRLETLLQDSPDRAAQLAGFDDVWERLKTQRPAGAIAAEVVRKIAR
ncbi:MAG: lipid-A-disaccharide synthase [Pseudomonadota bacterium]